MPVAEARRVEGQGANPELERLDERSRALRMASVVKNVAAQGAYGQIVNALLTGYREDGRLNPKEQEKEKARYVLQRVAEIMKHAVEHGTPPEFEATKKPIGWASGPKGSGWSSMPVKMRDESQSQAASYWSGLSPEEMEGIQGGYIQANKMRQNREVGSDIQRLFRNFIEAVTEECKVQGVKPPQPPGASTIQQRGLTATTSPDLRGLDMPQTDAGVSEESKRAHDVVVVSRWLRELRDEHPGLSHYVRTDNYRISPDEPSHTEEEGIVFSSRFAKLPEDEGKMQLLSTVTHENAHIHLGERRRGFQAAMRELEGEVQIPPQALSGREGERDEREVRLHLIVGYLEYDAMSTLVGEGKARQTIEGISKHHYGWVYQRILDGEFRAKMESIVHRHGLMWGEGETPKGPDERPLVEEREGERELVGAGVR